MELLPSQVRKIVLEEHTLIRKTLTELEKILSSPPTQAGSDATRAALEKLSEFTQIFLAHIDLEERILRPLLKSVDAWGEVRVDQMDREHQEQRMKVDELVQMMAKGLTAQLVAETKSFILELRQDMTSEERDCLSPELLKDDPINVNTSCG